MTDTVTEYHCLVEDVHGQWLEQAIARTYDDVVAWVDSLDYDSYPTAVTININEIGVVQ